jgi:uncharacterized protein HemY
LQPENDKAWSDLGWIFHKEKSYAKAIQIIERALAINADYLHTYRLGRAFWEQGITHRISQNVLV